MKIGEQELGIYPIWIGSLSITAIAALILSSLWGWFRQ